MNSGLLFEIIHERGELEKVITSKGMKPFYYFCDNVLTFRPKLNWKNIF